MAKLTSYDGSMDDTNNFGTTGKSVAPFQVPVNSTITGFSIRGSQSNISFGTTFTVEIWEGGATNPVSGTMKKQQVFNRSILPAYTTSPTFVDINFETDTGPLTGGSTMYYLIIYPNDGSTNSEMMWSVDKTSLIYPLGRWYYWNSAWTQDFGAVFNFKIYGTCPLASGVVSYWKLDEISGTTANSSVGSFPGTLHTNASFVSGGKINYGILSASSFSTVGGIGLGSPAGLDFSKYPISLQGWFKTSANGTQDNGGMNIVGGSKAGSNYSGIVIMMDMGVTTGDRGKIEFNYRNNSGTDYNLKTTSTYNDGNWHHVVGTINIDGVMKLYVDNSPVASGSTASGSMFTGTKNFYIGNNWNSDTSSVWVGYLDEIGIWNRELDSSEISTLYRSGSGLQYPFLSTSIKTVSGLDQASVKTVSGMTIANAKTIMGQS